MYVLFKLELDLIKTEFQSFTCLGLFTVIGLPYRNSRYLFLKYIMTSADKLKINKDIYLPTAFYNSSYVILVLFLIFITK